MKRVLVIDDDWQMREMMHQALSRAGYDVAEAPNGKVGMNIHHKDPVDLVITDLIMPEKGGISVFNTIRSISPASRIIIYTGFTSYRHSVFAREADAFVDKTQGAHILLAKLKELLY